MSELCVFSAHNKSKQDIRAKEAWGEDRAAISTGMASSSDNE